MKAQQSSTPKVWVASVDMGLGHQRATYPFRQIAEGEIININSAPYARPRELLFWNRLQRGYETLSRAKAFPVIGLPLFGLLDSLQHIPPFYPQVNMSHPNLQVRMLKQAIKKGLCSGMLETIRKKDLPLLTSYMTPAIAADSAGHERVYCILCDAEVHRAWVAENPAKSRIQYFAPCERTVRRLRSYGVPDERIFLTGFPFPAELLGGPDLKLLKGDIFRRLQGLDPTGVFRAIHRRSMEDILGQGTKNRLITDRRPILTLTFAVGGAGAQKEMGHFIARSLREKMQGGELLLNLVAGVRKEVHAYFEKVKREILPNNSFLRVIKSHTKEEYFDTFSKLIRTTDILWTKPSELSFYAGLGLPIILAPTIGSQEVYNKKWLLEIHAGIPQEDPRYTHEWLFDLLMDGRFADAAWDGFLKVKQRGLFRIMDILQNGVSEEALESSTGVLECSQ